MKIIKTALGWEIQPETSDEEDRVSWLLDCLKLYADQVIAEDAGAKIVTEQACPRCWTVGCWDGSHCQWCKYDSGHEFRAGKLSDAVIMQ